MANIPNIDELLKNDTAKGVALGLGVAIAGIAAIPAIISVGRPFARAALKSSLLLVEKGRETIAEISEDLEDMMAEVKAELVADKTEFSASEEAMEEVIVESPTD
jgi:hypothetical protein